MLLNVSWGSIKTEVWGCGDFVVTLCFFILVPAFIGATAVQRWRVLISTADAEAAISLLLLNPKNPSLWCQIVMCPECETSASLQTLMVFVPCSFFNSRFFFVVVGLPSLLPCSTQPLTSGLPALLVCIFVCRTSFIIIQLVLGYFLHWEWLSVCFV